MTDKAAIPQPGAIPTGSRRYIFSYVGNSIRKHKARSLTLLLGIIIGVALVSSVFVWTDTGSRVAVDDYFDENLFQYTILQRFEYPVDPNILFYIQDWLSTQYIYENSYVIYQSIGLLGVSGMSDSDPYTPYPYDNGIKDTQTFFLENDFLDRVQEKFIIHSGMFQVSPGQCVVSQQVVDDCEAILNATIGIGSFIDIAIAQIYPESQARTIGDINRLNITGVRIAGIYSFSPEDTVLYNAFSGSSRVNYLGSGFEQVFGWNDGIIFHHDQLTANQRDDLVRNSLFPKLFVRLNSGRVMQSGIQAVPQLIRNLKNQIEVAFQGIVGGERQLLFLEDYVAAYQSRQTMAVLVAPVIILSIFLTTFATNVFLSGRRSEVAILRARGASFRQLYSAFILEFVIIGIFALILGMIASLFVGSLIPASVGFLQFDLAIFYQFFAVVRLQPLTWVIAIITCMIPPLVFTMIYVRSFLKTEIYQAMVGINPPSETEFSITILYFVGCLAFLGLFIFAVVAIPATPSVAILQFIYAVAIWTLLSDSGSRLVRRIVAGATKGFRPLFGEKIFIFEKSMRTRRERIVPLLLILTLTFSVTVFAVVEAQTVQFNAYRQVEYYIGANLRVESDLVPYSRYSEISSIQGVTSATPLVRTWALIGSISFVLYGIDVEKYSTIGHWDSTSMVGEDWSIVLNRLQNDPNGVILPNTLAQRLGESVGQGVRIIVHTQGGGIAADHAFYIVGLGHSAPGLGYFDPDDPARPHDTTNGFQFQETQMYGFVNLAFMQNLNISLSRLFLAATDGNANMDDIQENVGDLGFPTGVYSPSTFRLEEAYPDGYLFNRGVVSILSIGFLASLLISIISLTLFVGVIVSERQTEYAIMRAVGSTRRQIVAVVVGEFIGLILSSFIVAIFLGFIFSWLLMSVLLNLFPFPFVVPFPIVIPFLLLLGVLGIVLIGMSIGTYIPARRAGRTNVGRVLRNL